MPIHGLEFTDSQLFDTLNVVLPAWILLALLPRWKHTYTVVTAAALYTSLLYSACLVSMMIAPSEDGAPDFSEMFTLEVGGTRDKYGLGGIGRGKSYGGKLAQLPRIRHAAVFMAPEHAKCAPSSRTRSCHPGVLRVSSPEGSIGCCMTFLWKRKRDALTVLRTPAAACRSSCTAFLDNAP